MFKRLIKVLTILSILIIFSTVTGMVVYDIYNPRDMFSFFEFVIIAIASAVPLIIVLVLKYIVYGSIR